MLAPGGIDSHLGASKRPQKNSCARAGSSATPPTGWQIGGWKILNFLRETIEFQQNKSFLPPYKKSPKKAQHGRLTPAP